MKHPFILFLWLITPLFCLAQNAPPLPREYSYDAAGNRTGRTTALLYLTPPQPPAPTPPDSLQVTSYALQEVASPVSFVSPELTTPDYFVETIAHVEMKIYPNPTTENITLQISNMETLQKGILQLYTLNGQLLQEQPVHSVNTIVSLAGLAKGTYILKVQINGITEDWKIIKN